MTSVDSGVETGNDSNDSAIVQHESLSTTVPHENVGRVVAKTVYSEFSCRRASHETEPGIFRIALGPTDPISVHLPISSLRPLIDDYNYAVDKQDSTATSSAGSFTACARKVIKFRFPLICDRHDQLLKTVEKRCLPKDIGCGSESNTRIIPSSYCARRNPYSSLTWIEMRGQITQANERRMRLAAANDDFALMKRFLRNGVSPNNQDEQGRTPLHLAVSRGRTEMVRLLLEHGANPNLRDSIGNTPLHLAAVTTNAKVVTLLLQAGTDVTSADKYGYNPLQWAETKLKLLQNCKGENMEAIKEEVTNVGNMLFVYLQKQKDATQKVEALGAICSRLSLSNTKDQVQDDIKDLLANLDALSITS